MGWTTGISDLRTNLSDGATDKYRSRKKVLGECNGSNTHFKTFESRRVTDLTAAAAPLGVYVAGTRLAPSDIASDDPVTGEFTLSTPPTDGQDVEASYYSQWFVDSEISEFLNSASRWLGLGADHTVIPDGLQPAALKYAQHDAYSKLALRFAEHTSEMYRLEDGQDPKRMEIVDAYQKASSASLKEAVSMRDDYYKRQGRANAPAFNYARGAVRNETPRR